MTTVYEALGGTPFFEQLVDRFYERVEQDPPLRALYPTDLTGSRSTLTLFLVQLFGGPTTYSDEKGHPRLRMRHAHIRIDDAARDGWFRAMIGALDSMGAPPELHTALHDYFDRSATWMINA